MANVIYISLTGMTESLGESQVLQYVIELAKKNSMSILSFEKPVDPEKYKAIERRLADLNIHWQYYTYSTRFGLISTAKQMLQAAVYLLKKIKKDKIDLIHARSLIPAVIALMLKQFSQVKLLFDIRGFAIDEKVLSGRIKEKSFLTKTLRLIEKKTYAGSDHVVTLTHISKPMLEKRYQLSAEKVTVIPTCANANLFKPISSDEKKEIKRTLGFSENDFVVLHSGSLNEWVDFEGEVVLYEQLALKDANIRFLILNKGQHEEIASYLNKFPVLHDRYKVLSIDFNLMSNYIGASDLCIFFIKPVPAKQASAPTKFAEIVSCQVYSVTNTGYGDMEYYLEKYPVGLLLDPNEIHSKSSQSADSVIQLIHEIKIQDESRSKKDFNDLFEQHFSTELAIKKYQKIYDNLSRGQL